MIKGHISQIKTSKATGDIVLAVEVPREYLKDTVELHLETVYLLSELEYADLQGYKKKEE